MNPVIAEFRIMIQFNINHRAIFLLTHHARVHQSSGTELQQVIGRSNTDSTIRFASLHLRLILSDHSAPATKEITPMSQKISRSMTSIDQHIAVFLMLLTPHIRAKMSNSVVRWIGVDAFGLACILQVHVIHALTHLWYGNVFMDNPNRTPSHRSCP